MSGELYRRVGVSGVPDFDSDGPQHDVTQCVEYVRDERAEHLVAFALDTIALFGQCATPGDVQMSVAERLLAAWINCLRVGILSVALTSDENMREAQTLRRMIDAGVPLDGLEERSLAYAALADAARTVEASCEA